MRSHEHLSGEASIFRLAHYDFRVKQKTVLFFHHRQHNRIDLHIIDFWADILIEAVWPVTGAGSERTGGYHGVGGIEEGRAVPNRLPLIFNDQIPRPQGR